MSGVCKRAASELRRAQTSKTLAILSPIDTSKRSSCSRGGLGAYSARTAEGGSSLSSKRGHRNQQRGTVVS
jgi:hypothetical protein